eukprot:m.23681 g.23681  ORF g.23681 m.23681 type:complete len:480 (+) comp14308_c0_seq1:125-1564(+)
MTEFTSLISDRFWSSTPDPIWIIVSVGMVGVGLSVVRRLVAPTSQNVDEIRNVRPVARQLPTNIDTSLIFQPLTLRGLVLKNRVIRAAAFGGSTIDDTIQTHVAVAEGGVGMTTIAYAAVSADGRTFGTQLVLTEDNLEDLKRLTSQVHDAGAAVSIQLTHAGSFSDRSVTKAVQLAPSSLFNPAGFDWPKEMDTADMRQVASEFASAAIVCQRAGFDAVEVHMGHGYLLSQFLSPYTNRRTDAYGGASKVNRARFPLEVLERVRSAVGDEFPILVKMNMHDGFEGGVTLDDAVAFARMFKRSTADCLVLSGGFTSRNGFYMLRGVTPLWQMFCAMGGVKGLAVLLFGSVLVPTVPFEEAFFRDYAQTILEEVGVDDNGNPDIPICLLGGIVSHSAIEGALANGFACVQMARALIHNPRFVNDIKASLIVTNANHDCDNRTAIDMEDIQSGCTHCNQCVVSTLNPTLPFGCVLTRQASK